MIALDVEPPRTALWLVGIAGSALIHLGMLLILLWVPAPAPVFEPAMMLELAPLTQAPAPPPTPEPPAEDVAPSPPTAAMEAPADPQTPPEQPVRQEEPPPTPESPDPIPPEPPQPAPEPVPELAIPDSLPVPDPPVPVPPPRPVTRPPPKPPAPRPIVRPTPPAPEATATPAPEATATPAPAPPVAQPSPQATADWRARLLAHLNRFKRYPATALMRRVQGVAFVHMLLMPDGTARDVRLHASSGAAVLDEEALSLIGRATPMPARPDSGPIELVVPVQFAVR